MRKLVVENFSVKETVTKSANRMSVAAGFNLRICAILVGVVAALDQSSERTKVDGFQIGF